jgi:hypothetical protein
VIAEDGGDVALAEELDALVGRRAISDDIAAADNLVHSVVFERFQDGLEGLEIAVDVTDYAESPGRMSILSTHSVCR